MTLRIAVGFRLRTSGRMYVANWKYVIQLINLTDDGLSRT